MKIKKEIINKKIALFLLIPFIISSCNVISVQNEAPPPPTQGFYRSNDLASTWEHSSSLYNLNASDSNFRGENIMKIIFDPVHDGTIYLASQHNGIYYSYNYGKGWFNTLSGKGTINDIVVDPLNNCTIFAAVHRSIYKTTDCSRTWEEVYFDTRSNGFITSIAVNGNDNRIVYAVNSLGDFLKSQDFGNSWDAIDRFPQVKFTKIVVMNDFDSNYIYLVSSNRGVWKSTNGGEEWEDLMELPVDQAEKEEDEFVAFSKIKGSRNTLSFDIDPSVEDGIIYTNTIGMFRLTDGKLWKQIKLLKPPKQERVYAAAVNPENNKEVFYVIKGAIYRTVDNGENWEIKKLPSQATPTLLTFSPDGEYLYLGFMIIKQK